MTDFILKLLLISLSGGIISILIFLLKPFLKKRVSKAFMYYVWAVVLLRLIVPFGIGIPLPTIPKTAEETQSEAYSEYTSESAENSVISDILENSEISEDITFSESTPIMPESSQTEEIPSQSIDESIVQSFPEEDFSAPQNSFPEQSDAQNETQEQSKEPSGIIIGDTDNVPPSPDENNENEYINTPPRNIEEPKTEKAFGFLNFLAKHAFSFWLCGFGVCMLWYSTAYLLYTRKLKKSFTAPNPADWKIFNEVCGNNKINLVMSSKVEIPMQIGIFNPKILLPKAEYSKNGREEQLRFILMHELVHFKRRDIVFKWLTIFVTSLHWFNPILYFVRREIAESCELACDEAVIKELNEQERKSYGNALITFSANRETAPFGTAATLFESKQQLKERLVNIMKFKKVTKSALCIMIAVSLLLCGCALTVLDVSEENSQDSSSVIESKNESIPDENESSEAVEESENSGESTDEEQTPSEQNEEALEAFRLVFDDEKKIIYTNSDAAGEYKLSELKLKNSANPPMYYEFSKIGLADFDSDGIREVIIHTESRSSYLVLKFSEGDIFGYRLNRPHIYELTDLKTDGHYAVYSFITSEFSGIRRVFDFKKSCNEDEQYAFSKTLVASSQKGSSGKMIYTFNNQTEEVTKEQFDEKINEFNNKEAVVWLEYNEDNIKSLLSSDYVAPVNKWDITKTDEALPYFKGFLLGQRKFIATQRIWPSGNEEYLISSYNVKKFCLIDLDGDNVPELVNRTDNRYIILRYTEGKMYGYYLTGEKYGELKSDGSFMVTETTENRFIRRFTAFNNDGFEYENIAIVDKNRSTSDPDDLMYTINGKTVSVEEGEAAVEKHLNSLNAVWYDHDTEIIRDTVTTSFFFGDTETLDKNLTDKEKALDLYAAVMHGKRKFRAAYQRPDYKKMFYISELSDYIAYDIEKYAISDFAVVNLSNNDIPNVVNRITNENNELVAYQILNYNKNTVYSCIVSPDLFQNLKQNGSYYWKLPVGDGYGIVDYSSFGNGMLYPYRDIGGYRSNESYFNDGVDFKTVEQWNKNNTDVEWYNFNTENIKKYISETYTNPLTHGDTYDISEEGVLIETETSGNQRTTIISHSDRSHTIITETFENGQRKTLNKKYYNSQNWLIGENDTIFENGIEVSKNERSYQGNIVETTRYEYQSKVYFSRKTAEGRFIREFKMEDGVGTTTNYFRDGELAYVKTTKQDRIEHTELRDANGTLLASKYNSTYFYYSDDNKVFAATYFYRENTGSFIKLSLGNDENPISVGTFQYNGKYEILYIESLGEDYTEESARAEFEEFAKIKNNITNKLKEIDEISSSTFSDLYLDIHLDTD